MGTPDFSVNTLRSLIDSRHEVVAVVTKQDKPKGRGKKVQMSPVKQVALENNIEVLQPAKVREEEFIKLIQSMKLDLIVVVAFGQIIPKEILDSPKYGCVNVHASLLPKYRGAGPIQKAILNGDKVTGITTMMMDVGLDTGDMLLKKEVEIESSDTGGSLFEKLSGISGELLLKTLDGLEKGNIVREKQNDELSSYAPMLSKSDGIIDFNSTPSAVFNKVRALNPWPSAYSFINGKMIKMWSVEPVYNEEINSPFEVLAVEKDYFAVGCKDGYVKVYEVQLQNKKRMATSEFLKGYSLKVGDKFSKLQNA